VHGSDRAARRSRFGDVTSTWYQEKGIPLQFHDNRFHLLWTPFLKNAGKSTLQAVALVCPSSLGSGGEFTLKVGDRKHTVQTSDLLRYPTDYLSPNTPAVYLWLVPRPRRVVRVQATWKTSSGHTYRNTLDLRSARPINIHVVLATHVDLGYTAPVADVIEQCQTEHLDRLLDNLSRTANNKPGQRFVSTMPTWILERCLDEAVTPQCRRALEKFIRNGQVVFGLAPFTPHSEFFGVEEMCRSLLAAHRLAEQYKVPVPRAAQLTGVPAHTAAYAMALAAAGCEFLQIGTNPDSRGANVPQLFWWKLPDARRVLCHYCGTYGTDLLPPSDYAYTNWPAIQVSHDNTGPGDLAAVDQVQWIAEHFEQPVCRIGRLEDFADAAARQDGKRLPTIEGEATDGWIDGIASQAWATALARRTKDLLPATEIVDTLAHVAANRRSTAGEAFRHAYEQLSLYTEHTWGDHASDGKKALGKNPYLANVSAEGKQPAPLDRWVHSWQDKALFAQRAAATTAAAEIEALDFAAETLAGRPQSRIPNPKSKTAPPTGVLLFNVASWPRGGLVTLRDSGLPAGEFELVDTTTGGLVLYERANGTIEFIAPPVPAGGYLYLEARPVAKRNLPGPEAEWNEKFLTLHFESYVLQFHTAGGMCRWHDRARSLQWCSNKVEYPMGAYLYDMPGGDRIADFARKAHGRSCEDAAGLFHRRKYEKMTSVGPVGGSFDTNAKDFAALIRTGSAKVIPQIGPLKSQVIVEADCPQPKAAGRRSGNARRYRTTFTLYRGQPELRVRIELLGKQPTYAAEAGYGFFPFYGDEPFVLVDRIAHLVEPSEDFLPGVNTAHLAVHRGVRIELEHAGMNFYPLHAPLLGFGAPGAYRYDDAHGYDSGVLYSTLFDNCWGTNFAQWQGGDLAYEYVCQPTGNDEWDGRLARGGLEVFRPIVGTVVHGMKPPLARSLVRIEPDWVQLVAMKPAESGRGIILRLWSADPDPTTAKLNLPFAKRGSKLEICDLLERPTGRRIALNTEGMGRVPMKPHELMTLQLSV
jgi:hypothetical protein